MKLIFKFSGCVMLFLCLMSSALCRERTQLDDIAERYVKLALRVGLYKADYIDAYFGPPEWRPASIHDTLAKIPYTELKAEASALLEKLGEVEKGNPGLSAQPRRKSLRSQIKSVAAVIEIINGKKMTFDEESMALYGAKAPSFDSLHYDSLLQKLDKVLPGEGNIQSRYMEFRKHFLVSHDKIDTLIKVAIAECRARTKQHIRLPEGESFVTEMVGRKPWGAYNWFKGNNISLIQVDTSDDQGIGSIIALAAHEGYPGHHVQNVLEESGFYRDSGWVEFCVQPLFAPRNLIAEGMADFCIKLLFPKTEWLAYVKGILCPLAGIDTLKIEQYYDVNKALSELNAGVDGARDYLDGKKSKEATIAWRMYFNLQTRKEAEDGIDFYDNYRSYVITYSVGGDLIRNYIEANGGTEDNPGRRWELFISILTHPTTPEDLVQ